jgi:hypothetical protein
MTALFPGSERAHATYDPSRTERSTDGKVKVNYRTVRRPATLEDWQEHLKGNYPLVMAPLCDDGTSVVSCVDIDDRSINPLALVEKIKRFDFRSTYGAPNQAART